VGQDVQPKLQAAGLVSQAWIRISATFNGSTDHNSTPTLEDWRQNYDCAPSELSPPSLERRPCLLQTTRPCLRRRSASRS
jgi:hypothetical protein